MTTDDKRPLESTSGTDATSVSESAVERVVMGDALSDEELQAISDLAAHWMDHADRCDMIANRPMAERQKQRDLVRVSALQKAHRIVRRAQGLFVYNP